MPSPTTYSQPLRDPQPPTQTTLPHPSHPHHQGHHLLPCTPPTTDQRRGGTDCDAVGDAQSTHYHSITHMRIVITQYR